MDWKRCIPAMAYSNCYTFCTTVITLKSKLPHPHCASRISNQEKKGCSATRRGRLALQKGHGLDDTFKRHRGPPIRLAEHPAISPGRPRPTLSVLKRFHGQGKKAWLPSNTSFNFSPRHFQHAALREKSPIPHSETHRCTTAIEQSRIYSATIAYH